MNAYFEFGPAAEGRVNRAQEAAKMAPSEFHTPVLLDEVVRLLTPAPGKLFVDGTLGGGGHSAALLAAGAAVIGIDQDPDAITYATARLERHGSAFRAVHSSFDRIADVLDSIAVPGIDGALLDLGVSSHQLDTPERGFSFQREGRLDMRMDPAAPVTAADLVNTMSAEQLTRIFRVYGEEPASKKISAHLVRARAVQPFATTLQLAEAVASVVPRRGKTHPATRVFQALRIAVNRELDALELALRAITDRLKPGARFGVISFHSLEDKLVKSFFADHSLEWLDRPEWPEPRRNPDCIFRRVTRKAVVASEIEQRANPRSRSAKLRVVERLPYAA